MRLHQYIKELIIADLAFDENESSANQKRAIQHHPQFIDSVRGMFPEGEELYPTARFQKQNHIQICVVNPNCILGYFRPMKYNNWYKRV
jgi:hypothetical protein